MSDNTKASKIDRLLTRQIETDKNLDRITYLMRQDHEMDTQTIKILAAALQSRDAELNALRKYVGSILFARRRLQALELPTLEPKWGNHR